LAPLLVVVFSGAGATYGVIFAAKVKNHGVQMNRFLTNFLYKNRSLGMRLEAAVFSIFGCRGFFRMSGILLVRR